MSDRYVIVSADSQRDSPCAEYASYLDSKYYAASTRPRRAAPKRDEALQMNYDYIMAGRPTTPRVSVAHTTSSNGRRSSTPTA